MATTRRKERIDDQPNFLSQGLNHWASQKVAAGEATYTDLGSMDAALSPFREAASSFEVASKPPTLVDIMLPTYSTPLYWKHSRCRRSYGEYMDTMCNEHLSGSGGGECAGFITFSVLDILLMHTISTISTKAVTRLTGGLTLHKHNATTSLIRSL